MDIQSWFDNNGSYADGFKLYSELPSRNNNLVRNFLKENPSNFLKLKYELKKALLSGANVVVATPIIQAKKEAEPKKKEAEHSHKEIIEQSVETAVKKESMAMYPMELHATYRERISNWYLACELKFQLNACSGENDEAALKIIIQLEDLWTKIDRAWKILDHWKDHNRIMPTDQSENFSSYSKDKLFLMRNRLEVRISKREKTIQSKREAVASSPEDRTLLNALNSKLEQLHQLKIDLETIRKLLKDE
jgi:hypothetical protein